MLPFTGKATAIAEHAHWTTRSRSALPISDGTYHAPARLTFQNVGWPLSTPVMFLRIAGGRDRLAERNIGHVLERLQLDLRRQASSARRGSWRWNQASRSASIFGLVGQPNARRLAVAAQAGMRGRIELVHAIVVDAYMFQPPRSADPSWRGAARPWSSRPPDSRG